ncbi:MAG: acyl-ACP--UDP-N-acetylglucosamine O-acyltransferase [Bacteroidetes bacterium]|nr:acyl-ACP--UDP-N-acetylglucosamine O-acyltransferase [Bacteroidota bacterium]
MSQLSYISPKAKLGANVKVEPFSTIYDDVEIGDNTWIGPNVTIFDGARIGKNCKIFPGAVIAPVPQDLKFEGEVTTVEIGDNTVIREHVTVHRGTKDKHKTVIGSNCLIMVSAHVAHDCTIGNGVILASFVGLAGHCIIEDYAILEGFVGVQQFVRVGAHSFIAGGSLVRKNVPPFVRAAKEPLSYVGINSVGLKRRGYTDEMVRQIEDIYRMIYVRGHNLTNALAIVETEAPASKEKVQIVDFIKESVNGIMRGLS